MSKDGIINRLLIENENWKQALGFISKENSELKTGLAEFLSTLDRTNYDVLEITENFQNLFIKEDETVRSFRIEIADQQKLLVRDLYEDGDLFHKVIMRQQKLRKEFKKMKEGFKGIKSEFTKYVKNVKE
ncbi:MAG TPA: hypothetical protein VMI12_03575 [Puia sp.]|nr:hypothetical protein [Puia sp.]